MRKEIVIKTSSLKKEIAAETTLFNFHIEKDLYNRFKDVCENEFQQKNISVVLRKIIEQICNNSKKRV